MASQSWFHNVFARHLYKFKFSYITALLSLSTVAIILAINRFRASDEIPQFFSYEQNLGGAEDLQREYLDFQKSSGSTGSGGGNQMVAPPVVVTCKEGFAGDDCRKRSVLEMRTEIFAVEIAEDGVFGRLDSASVFMAFLALLAMRLPILRHFLRHLRCQRCLHLQHPLQRTPR